MTKLDQLISGYLNRENLLDPTQTITFLYHAAQLSPREAFSEATVEYAHEVVQVWRPSWLKGIDFD